MSAAVVSSTHTTRLGGGDSRSLRQRARCTWPCSTHSTKGAAVLGWVSGMPERNGSGAPQAQCSGAAAGAPGGNTAGVRSARWSAQARNCSKGTGLLRK